MKHYLKPLFSVIELSSNDNISAENNIGDIEGSIASSNYTGPENAEW